MAMMNHAEGAFLRAGEVQKPKELIEYEMAEMEAELDVFSDDEVPVVLKYIAREPLTSLEAEILRSARARWFEEKYGIPYFSKAARDAKSLCANMPNPRK